MPNPSADAGPSQMPQAVPDDGISAALQTLSAVLSRLADGQEEQSSLLREQAHFQRSNSRMILSQLATLSSSGKPAYSEQPAAPAPPPVPVAAPQLDQSPDPPTQPGFIVVPPSTSNAGTGALSLVSLYPEIKESMLLAISRHKFKPALLFELDTRIKEKPSPNVLDFENRSLAYREREPSIKEYASFASLFNPLVLYFSILQVSVCSSGSLPATRQVIYSCHEYLRNLYDLYIDYEWMAILNYHFAFHAKRLPEMARGDFSHWSEIDGALQTKFLIGHPRRRANKDGGIFYQDPNASG